MFAHDTEISVWHAVIAALAITALLAFLAYSNTWHSPLVFDDVPSISHEPYFSRFSFTAHDWRELFAPRGLTTFTFGANYYFGGENVLGYHVVNFIIHLLNSFLVFALVYYLSQRSFTRKTYSTELFDCDNHVFLAAVAALLFAVHPIQTMAVTYIAQRLTLLATFFYLVALVSYVKSRMVGNILRNTSAAGWFCMTILAALLAMFSKEISATIPVSLLLVEAAFFTSDIFQFRTQLLYLLPLLVLLFVVPAFYVGLVPFLQINPLNATELSERLHSFDVEHLFVRTVKVPAFQYPLTEPRVIMRYIRLLFLPVGQNVDHDVPLSTSLLQPFTTLLSLLTIIGLLGLAFVLWKRGSRFIAFGIVFFFLGLVIESSVIVLPDVMFEYRLYLPMVGFVIVIAGLIEWALERYEWRYVAGRIPAIGVIGGLLMPLIIALTVATFERNTVWADEVTFWSDATVKSPHKIRPVKNLGVAYSKLDDLEMAIKQFQRVIEIDPLHASGYNNLGSMYAKQGRYADAFKVLLRAQELDPLHAGSYHNMGSAYALQGQWKEALEHYQESIAVDSTIAVVQRDMGTALAQLGRLEEARNAFERALELDPELSLTSMKLEEVQQLLNAR